MTTQEKTDAIKKIGANWTDNRAAIKAAGGIEPLLDELINEAAREAFKGDLVAVFALKPK